jgi:hypothetical protein
LTPVPGGNKVYGIYEIVNKSNGKNLMGDGAPRELKGPGKPTRAGKSEGLEDMEKLFFNNYSNVLAEPTALHMRKIQIFNYFFKFLSK